MSQVEARKFICIKKTFVPRSTTKLFIVFMSQSIHRGRHTSHMRLLRSEWLELPGWLWTIIANNERLNLGLHKRHSDTFVIRIAMIRVLPRHFSFPSQEVAQLQLTLCCESFRNRSVLRKVKFKRKANS